MEKQEISNVKELLIKIKKIINQDKNYDKDYISLNSIINILKQPSLSIKEYENKLKEKVENLFTYPRNITINELNFKNFCFYVKDYYDEEYNFAFYRYLGDWYSKTNNEDDKQLNAKILYRSYNILQNIEKTCKYAFIFDEKLSMNENTIINSIENLFDTRFGPDGVSIEHFNLFTLSYDIMKNEFDYSQVPSTILNIIYKKEEVLFEKIYLPIKKCPEWMQPYLTKIREDELAKPKYIEPIPNETNVELAKQQNKTSNSSNNQKKKKFKNIFKKH